MGWWRPAVALNGISYSRHVLMKRAVSEGEGKSSALSPPARILSPKFAPPLLADCTATAISRRREAASEVQGASKKTGSVLRLTSAITSPTAPTTSPAYKSVRRDRDVWIISPRSAPAVSASAD